MKTHIMVVCFLMLVMLIPGLTQGASDFPTEPITYVYPQPAGGKGDLAARLHAKLAEKHLGQPIIIVNKEGGSGTVGTAAVATAKPNGYTIGNIGPSPLLLTPYLVKLSYHPIKDFEFIMQYGYNVYGVSVRYDSPFKTFKEVIQYARENPGVVVYGSTGTNSAQHITIDKIARDEKVEMTHVPFKGGSTANMAAIGGHVTMAVGEVSVPLIQGKKLRCLGVLTDERWPDLPDVPTLKELGYKVPVPMFLGIGAPKGVPEPILQKLEDAFTKAYKDPELVSGMAKLGIPLFYRNRKDFSNYIAKGYEEVGEAIKEMKK
jgi:tripartite-type tricarboxylate transporter receptor subunit TctC